MRQFNAMARRREICNARAETYNRVFAGRVEEKHAYNSRLKRVHLITGIS